MVIPKTLFKWTKYLLLSLVDLSEVNDLFCRIVLQNDFRVAHKLPWRLTEVPFLKFSFVPGLSILHQSFHCQE